MIFKWTFFFTISLIIALNAAVKERFDNHRLYGVRIDTLDQLELFQNLDGSSDGLLLWNSPVLGGTVDIMVAPHKLSEFNRFTQLYDLRPQLKMKNVQSIIDAESSTIRPKDFGWTAYNNYTEVYQWLDDLLETYPDILTSHIVGTSYQGREIRAVKLAHNETNPTIFIEANIHAREWITSATATCFLNELLTSTVPEIVDLAHNINWYIVPIFNIDGFHYTHTTNRMWRKTRQPHAHICYGTDANRNFDTHWMEGGASQNPCSETYAGPNAMSEPEAVALSNFVGSIARTEGIDIYLAFHSYSLLILHPYGHTVEPADNYENLHKVGLKAAEGFASRYNTTYTVGSFGEALYIGSGTSVDYMYTAHGIPLSYTFEFRDEGQYGFILPPEQIIPNCQETTDAIIAMVAAARELNQF